MKLQLRNGYDSEYGEANNIISKTSPVMGVVIEDKGYAHVVDVTQGTMQQVLDYVKQYEIDEVENLIG